MKDLKTLLSSDATDFERQLLGAAAGEGPSPELQLRMQQAIGLGPVALHGRDAGPDASIGGPKMSGTPMAVKATANRWAAGTWLKVVLGVGAGAGLVAGGLAIHSSEPAPLTPASTLASEPPAPPAPVDAPAPSAAASRELREEIDLLDRVRAALAQRDARAASALLESYANRFPEGMLTREATVLRARAAQVARTAR
jgi:hypothetical protein